MQVDIPQTLLAEIDELVALGAFASRETAVIELLRLGLASFRDRGSPRPGPGRPPRPPTPPGRNEPRDDDPIHVDPSDVNWVP